MNLQENINRLKEVMGGVINESQYSNNLKRRVHILDSLIDNLLPNMYPCDFDNEDDFFTGVYHELRHLIEDEQYGLENLDRKDMIEYIYQNRQDEILEYYRERCENKDLNEQLESNDPDYSPDTLKMIKKMVSKFDLPGVEDVRVEWVEDQGAYKVALFYPKDFDTKWDNEMKLKWDNEMKLMPIRSLLGLPSYSIFFVSLTKYH